MVFLSENLKFRSKILIISLKCLKQDEQLLQLKFYKKFYFKVTLIVFLANRIN